MRGGHEAKCICQEAWLQGMMACWLASRRPRSYLAPGVTVQTVQIIR